MFLLDSNVFLTAKNLYYNPRFCEPFWETLLESFEQGISFSIDTVKKELTAGTPDKEDIEAENYFKKIIEKIPSKCWFKADDFLGNYKEIALYLEKWIKEGNTKKRAENFRRFSKGDSADIPLIACAMSKKIENKPLTVVTQENRISDNNIKMNNNIKIPNICEQFNVSHCNLFSFLKIVANQRMGLKDISLLEDSYNNFLKEFFKARERDREVF